MTQTPTAPTQIAQPVYEITDADKQRHQEMDDAWKAFEGDLVKPLKPMEDEADDNVMVNPCRKTVNVGKDFLFGKEVKIAADKDAPEEAQKYLDDVWGRTEKRMPQLQKLEMNGAIAGTAFLRIVPIPTGLPRLVPIDPRIVNVQTAPQDCDTVLLYCLEYCTEEMRDGKPIHIYYREEIAPLDASSKPITADNPWAVAQWQVQHWSKEGEKGDWISSGDPITWPYAFSPLFACQNLTRPNSFWGYSDITSDVIGLNNALNLNGSNTNRTIKIYGNPLLYANGMGEAAIDAKPGVIASLPLPESKIGAVSFTTDIPGSIQFADTLHKDISEETQIPFVASGRDSTKGPMSGIAIELEYMPIIKKTDAKRNTYGELLIEVSEALLVIGGFSPDIKISLSWINPLPNDDLGAAQAALLLKQIGVSDQTLLDRLGFDPEEEMRRNQEEDTIKLTNFSRGVGMPPAPGQQQPAPGQPGAQDAQQGQPGPFIGR